MEDPIIGWHHDDYEASGVMTEISWALLLMDCSGYPVEFVISQQYMHIKDA